MFQVAVKAGLPLIAVSSTDVLNLVPVIGHLTDRPVIMQKPSSVLQPKKGSLNVIVMNGKVDDSALADLYNVYVGVEATLVLVNAETKSEIPFRAGELPTPKALIQTTLVGVLQNEAWVAELMPSLGGMTLKDVGEVIRLTMARDGSLTPSGVMKTRKQVLRSLRGLTLVDTAQPFYDAPADLLDWLSREADYFMNGTDPRLVARGLLFDGDPGTGKSAGAKYIAQRMGLPLYRLDVGAAQAKYVGQSEENLSAALSRLDQEAPCVVLIDEVEKLFTTKSSDTSGVNTSMLASLLWWMAEHKSRVLTLMTSNKRNAIPPELYREGRIDEVLVFKGLEHEEAQKFCSALLETFDETSTATRDFVAKTLKSMFMNGNAGLISQSKLTKIVYDGVKQFGRVKKSTQD